jgi:thymidylate synthase
MTIIEEANISHAWRKLFHHSIEAPTDSLSPVMLTTRGVSVDAINEDLNIRTILDKALHDNGHSSVDTVANTLFPKTLWNRALPRQRLYERYLDFAWRRVRKCSGNVRGTYFQRFIAYDLNVTQPIKDQKAVNQLEHVIDTWKTHENHRHSALQLSVFDPTRDHRHNRQLGFPCLHQVAFTPAGTNGKDGLSVTGFYATQTLFEKAYGNYVGLCRLGQFVAHELGLSFIRMTCLTALLKPTGGKKSDLNGLERQLLKLGA